MEEDEEEAEEGGGDEWRRSRMNLKQIRFNEYQAEEAQRMHS